MCKDCGCSIVGDVVIDGANAPEHTHPHDHTHDHDHSHPHVHPQEQEAPSDGHRRSVPVHQAILDKNDRLAERNRGYFLAKGLLVLNVLSPQVGS